MAATMTFIDKQREAREQNKKDKMIHVTPEEAAKITGYDSQGYPVSQQRKDEQERKREDRKEGGLLASICVMM